jgi:hypothetical protein
VNPLVVDEHLTVRHPNGATLGRIYREIDGYYVFVTWVSGYWESPLLRAIADKLDEMNAEWDEEVRRGLMADAERVIDEANSDQ